MFYDNITHVVIETKMFKHIFVYLSLVIIYKYNMTVVYLKIAWPEGVVHTRRMMIGMCTGRNIIYIILLCSLLQNNKEKKNTEIIIKNSCAQCIRCYSTYNIYRVLRIIYEDFDDPNFFTVILLKIIIVYNLLRNFYFYSVVSPLP